MEVIMNGFDPNESIGFHCSLTYRAFVKALEKRLQNTGISPVQFIALAYLNAFGIMPQMELASYLSTTPVSIVKLIDRMERDGWVERHPSAKDRRVKQVIPTEKAKSIWSSLTVQARSVVEQAYVGIPKEEIDRTKSTLHQIRMNLSD
jgi:MarR family transcriptional regulator for hemolysin